MIGKTISHYVILEKLGEGGMGVVYLAEDSKLGRKVALKFLSRHAVLPEEEHRRFIHEAQAAASLSHANISTIYEIEESEEGPKTVWRVNPVAIREQLKQLPQRAIVAWACRCARRVQHLNSDPRLDRSITMAESTVFGPEDQASQESLAHALQRVHRLRTASFRAAYTGGPARKQDPASYAALAAAAAGACAAARCAEDAAADAAFVAQNAVTALELAEGQVSEFWQWAQRDYQHLLGARLGEKGTIGRPLPTDFWQESE